MRIYRRNPHVRKLLKPFTWNRYGVSFYWFRIEF